jgi:type IV pilus assembly protein PilM
MAGYIFYMQGEVKKREQKKAQLEADIAAIQDIENIINAYEAQLAQTTDIKAMSASTFQLNEQCLQFVKDLETVVPKDVVLQSFAADAGGISMPCTSMSYDSIAQLIINLKKLPEIENAYVASISQAPVEGTDDTLYTFSVTCNYTDPTPVVEEEEAPAGEIVTEE